MSYRHHFCLCPPGKLPAISTGVYKTIFLQHAQKMGAGASCLNAVDALNAKVVDLSHFDVQRQLGKVREASTLSGMTCYVGGVADTGCLCWLWQGGFGAVNAVTKRTNPEKGKWFAMKVTGA